jgi:hypothetical protein
MFMHQRQTSTAAWRRTAAMLLVVFWTLLLAPLALASSPTGGGALPACCRAHGRHHCADAGQMASQMASDGQDLAPADTVPSFTKVTQRCPYTPSAPVMVHGDGFDPATTADLYAAIEAQTVARVRTQTRLHVLHDRSCRKRGPPVISL